MLIMVELHKILKLFPAKWGKKGNGVPIADCTAQKINQDVEKMSDSVQLFQENNHFQV